MSLGFSPSFSLKKIKNNPTQKAKIENIKTKRGVSKLDAKNVPSKIPIATKIPNDLINLKSTALYFMCVLVDIIDVGIMIAKEVPKDRCIIVDGSKLKVSNA